MARLPFVPGMTETAKDAEPLVYSLAEVLERNPALALSNPAELMQVIQRISENRMTVQGSISAGLRSLEVAFARESDPMARVQIAGWISEIRDGEKGEDTHEEDDAA